METIEKILSDYWTNKLKNMPVVDPAPLEDEKINSVDVTIEKECLLYFNKITSNNYIKEFIVLLTLYGALLQRYFEDSEMISSSSLVQDLDTPFLYSLGHINDQSLKQFLNGVKEEVQEVYKYRDYKSLSKKKVYTIYGYSYNENKSYPTALSLKISYVQGKAMQLNVECIDRIADISLIKHFLNVFKYWVENLEQILDQKVSELAILSDAEKSDQINRFEDDDKYKLPSNKTICELFEEQAKKTPKAVALQYEAIILTYDEVNERSNQLANYLVHERHLLANDFIGVKLARSEKLIISLLAVLKLGATYVPMDIDYPIERLAYIENDSNCKLVLDIDEWHLFEKNQNTFSKTNLDRQKDENDVAYVIYTSGTTGNPKGVMITHLNAVSFITWSKAEFARTNFDVVYATTSHCFDLSVFEIFYTLSVGKKIRVLDNALSVGEHLRTDRNVLLNTVPSSIRNILDEEYDLTNIVAVNLAGEPFPVDIAHRLLKYKIEIRNLYGPSEDTTYSTCYKLTDADLNNFKSISIGKPIANTQAYILDENLQLLPVGVIGKLYISGSGVAQGYLNLPELTKQKFLANPFVRNKRMYDTGDLAKWLPSGNLEFLGRKDNQIKIRGYRVELEEIEAIISNFSSHIQQAVVIVKKAHTEAVLIGYYVATGSIDKIQLMTYLHQKLPSYMVPNHVIKVDYIPVTPNGKVDKKVLDIMLVENTFKESYVPPRDKFEEDIIEIWEKVIGVKGIGIEDNFFELGGHSLMISQIINQIKKKFDKSVSYKFFYTTPTIKCLRDTLKTQEFTHIKPAPIDTSYPATLSQQRIWLLSQVEQGAKAHQITMAITIEGNVATEDFVRAFTYITERHEILRTYFKNDQNGVLQQYIVPQSEFDFHVEIKDFSQSEFPQQAVNDYIRDKTNRAYDLSEAPLFNGSLLKIGLNKYVFFMSMHHIISDGWSLEVLTLEIIEAYEQLTFRQVIDMPDLPIQYKDYAVWLTKNRHCDAQQQAKEYWTNTFQGDLPTLQMPSFAKRPLLKTFAGEMESYSFTEETLFKMKAFSKEHQVTLFMLLMSGVKTLLYRYSNQNDIIVGTPVAGRDHQDLENQVGLYINILAIRTQIGEQDRFIDLLEREKHILLQAYSHQHFSLDQLLDELTLTRDKSRSPLFDVMVVLQNQKQVSRFRSRKSVNELKIDDYQLKVEYTHYDLSFVFVEDESLILNIYYNTSIFEKAFIEMLFGHLGRLFDQAISNPCVKLNDIELLSSVEKHQVLFEYNNNSVAYPAGKTLIDLFDEQVVLNSHATAIVFEDRAITYGELNIISNQLANYLLSRFSVTAEDLVCVILDRSEWSVISFLAILKSGGVYVPIDPTYPQQRIDYIIQDSKCKIILDDVQIENFLQGEINSPLAPEVTVGVDQLAYIIYTSGSTGNPKGVLVEHKGIVNTILAAQDVLDAKTHKKFLQYASFCFDAAVFEIFIGLLSGSCLYITSEVVRRDPGLLENFIEEKGIDFAVIFPAYLKMMNVDKLSALKTLVTAGEAASYEKTLEFLKRNKTKCFNGYGPTEVSVCSTLHEINTDELVELSSVPIGSSIPNTQAYILNNDHFPQPIGVVGEICVGGAGLARGYLNRPDLTNQKFVPNPFIKSERLYKTGDLGRWLPGGIIDFVGRKDDQVKVRGYRIELGEIESALLQHGQITNAVVLGKQTLASENELIAYIVSSVQHNLAELREHLRKSLPDYMIPSQFVQLNEFPFTPSGKVDKVAIKASTAVALLSNNEYVAPRNEIEKQLTLIWQEILGVKNIGVTDDFFTAGGHSLKAAAMLSKVNKTFGISINFELIFELRCIEELSVLVDNLLWQKENITENQVVQKITI